MRAGACAPRCVAAAPAELRTPWAPCRTPAGTDGLILGSCKPGIPWWACPRVAARRREWGPHVVRLPEPAAAAARARVHSAPRVWHRASGHRPQRQQVLQVGGEERLWGARGEATCQSERSRGRITCRSGAALPPATPGRSHHYLHSTATRVPPTHTRAPWRSPTLGLRPARG